MAAAAIFKIIFFAITRPLLPIYTKFDTKRENGFPEPDLASNVNYRYCKNLRWRNQSNGDNSEVFEPICTKFDTRTENDIPDHILSAKLISQKIKYGCHIEIHILSHKPTTGPLLRIFAPNLTQWLKTGSHSQICRQNSRIAKIQDGGRRYCEIS